MVKELCRLLLIIINQIVLDVKYTLNFKESIAYICMYTCVMQTIACSFNLY